MFDVAREFVNHAQVLKDLAMVHKTHKVVRLIRKTITVNYQTNCISQLQDHEYNREDHDSFTNSEVVLLNFDDFFRKQQVSIFHTEFVISPLKFLFLLST